MPIAISQNDRSRLISLKCAHMPSLVVTTVGALMTSPMCLLLAMNSSHSGTPTRKGPMLSIAMIWRQFMVSSNGVQIHGITTPPVLVAVSTMPIASP
jgi:hypothetical protein